MAGPAHTPHNRHAYRAASCYPCCLLLRRYNDRWPSNWMPDRSPSSAGIPRPRSPRSTLPCCDRMPVGIQSRTDFSNSDSDNYNELSLSTLYSVKKSGHSTGELHDREYRPWVMSRNAAVDASTQSCSLTIRAPLENTNTYTHTYRQTQTQRVTTPSY